MDNNYQSNNNLNSENNEFSKQQKKSKGGVGIKTLTLVVVIAALLGGGIGGAVVHLMNNKNQTIKTTTGATTQPTKISNVVVKENSDSEKAFNKVKDAVVSVINLQKQQPTSSLFGGIFGSQRGNSSGNNSGSLQESSEGSGVIYQKSNGQAFVVTNNHVVAGSDKLEVLLSDGSKVNAKLLGTDSVTDLAVLQIDAAKVKTVASFGDSNAISPGQKVLAIGSPMGSKFATSVTQGIVSAKSRTIDVSDEDTGQTTGQATVIQTDAAINPGNSGGALINIGGQVIGITSMKLSGSSSSTSVEGMGFAIPSSEVVQIVNQLEKNGKVARPALGVSPVDLSDVSSTQQSSVLHLPSSVKTGVVVVSLTDNSPAAKGGVKQYDVIYQIDGKKVDTVVDLRTQLFKYQIGDTITLSVYRGSEKMDLKVKLTETAKQEITTKQGQNN
ncbi:S1C family serine protease [Xylocopilactobacillus apicola]|uniref:Serine protease n=1 Tax=Xylocopilactobacillus apicola TaxID=2932184 RepID=A0AAU9DCZ4_9LACO|nr:trypsin-like peptidase domain-containing protein [Xylocopilactobacillus apicola]BDR58682.1 serine protease [Xylocopilactobacillus apicola]